MTFDDLSQSRFSEDLKSAAGHKPITESDLVRSYERYKDVGVAKGRVKRNMSDSELYKMATSDVIKWHKHVKEVEAKRKAEEAAARVREEQARRAAEQAAAQQAAAMRQQQEAAARAAQQAVSRPVATGGGGGGSAPAPAPSVSRQVDPNWARQQLEANGLGNATPPPYALTSQQALLGWITRNRPKSARPASQPMSYATKGTASRPGVPSRPAPTRVTTTRPIATNRRPVIR